MELREIENYGLKILNEKAKDGSMTVYAKFTETEIPNQNFRTYPLGIMTREVDRLQSKINAGQFLGQSDHSDSPATFLKDVSHVVTKLEMVKNDGYATIKILNTDAGRNVQEIIRGSGKIGISTRSVGTVSAKGIVQRDMKLLALDLVANPSVADATIGKENILEGLNFEENLDEATFKCSCVKCEHIQNAPAGKHCTDIKCEKCGGTMRRASRPGPGKEDLEKEINALEKESWLSACDSGYKGSQEDWEKQYSGSLREMMGLPKAEGRETNVEKLTEEQISKRTFSYYQEAVQSGYREDFNTWKKKFPQIVESASKVKIVAEKKVEPKASVKARMSLAEARQSGFTGTIAEWREQHPDIELILPASPQEKVTAEKILTEKALKQEAGRIFTALSADHPNSQLTLESVIQMLEKEEEKKTDKRIRRKAIAIVSRDLDGSLSQDQIEKMVAKEIENLKEERRQMRERNWNAYRRLL
ncbi:MAG: hypothetical protein KAT65_03915 [Methanophagales archaeon]|nr:hypothetical protein [Methanophagales archaeon]